MTTTTTHPLLVSAYARNIITYGNRDFTTIPADYVQPVKEHIAQNYTNAQIDKALENRYITEHDFTDIMTLKTTA